MKGSSLGSRACILLTLVKGRERRFQEGLKGSRHQLPPNPTLPYYWILKAFSFLRNLLKPKCS